MAGDKSMIILHLLSDLMTFRCGLLQDTFDRNSGTKDGRPSTYEKLSGALFLSETFNDEHPGKRSWRQTCQMGNLF